MRIPDPKANTATEAYLAYKAGYLEESELKPVLYKPDWHFDGWLAYWAGLVNTYPTKENGDPEMLCDEEALVAYLSGVTDTYPEEIKDPYDVRIVGYLKHLASIRWPEPDYPVNNEEFYLSTMEPTHTSNPVPSSDIELDTAEGKIISVEAYGDTYQQTYSGKNIIDFTTISYSGANNGSGTRNGATFTVTGASNGNYGGIQFTQSNLQLKTDTTYTVSATVVSTTNTDGSMVYANSAMSSTGSQIYGSNAKAGERTVATFTTPSSITNSASLRLYPGIADGVAVFTDIMIEESATATSYEPYVGGIPAPNPDYPQAIQVVTGEQTITISDGIDSEDFSISLGAIELCKVGDYQDYIYKGADGWYVHKEVGKQTIDGTSTWTVQNNTKTNYVYYQTTSPTFISTGVNNVAPALSTQLIAMSGNVANNSDTSSGFAFSTSGYLRVNLPRVDFPNVAAVKSHFTANPMDVCCALETPTDTQITDAGLIADLNALAGADTYNGKTYIKVTATDPNLPALLKVEAYKY